jgi:hypothetical protein
MGRSQSQCLSLVVSGAVLALVTGALRLTGIGLKLRALADNPIQLALAGLLAGVSALLTAYEIGFDPSDQDVADRRYASSPVRSVRVPLPQMSVMI